MHRSPLPLAHNGATSFRPNAAAPEKRASQKGIGLCDRPRRGQAGLGLATLVPGLAATIALAGASHGALLYQSD
jgi:hypothetical protein